jgi:5-hydroxyisourate hydrolase
MTISTHVLDTARGLPAAGIAVALERSSGDGWEAVGRAVTDADGRARELGPVAPGRHRLTFETGAYLGAESFYPRVSVEFVVAGHDDRCHVPLLLSPFGYSTYRGS